MSSQSPKEAGSSEIPLQFQPKNTRYATDTNFGLTNLTNHIKLHQHASSNTSNNTELPPIASAVVVSTQPTEGEDVPELTKLEEEDPAYFKWVLLALCFVSYFGNALVNYSVKSTTNNLRNEANLNHNEGQWIVTSCTFILAIPLSIYGSFIVHKLGCSLSIVTWNCGAILGWLLFCVGVQYSNVWIMGLGRTIQGGALVCKLPIHVCSCFQKCSTIPTLKL